MSRSETYELEKAKGIFFDTTRLHKQDLRLTFYNGMPYEFSTEVKLTKNDVKHLIGVLQNGLDNWKDD